MARAQTVASLSLFAEWEYARIQMFAGILITERRAGDNREASENPTGLGSVLGRVACQRRARGCRGSICDLGAGLCAQRIPQPYFAQFAQRRRRRAAA